MKDVYQVVWVGLVFLFLIVAGMLIVYADAYYTTTLDFKYHTSKVVILWDEFSVQLNTHDQKYYRDIPYVNITVTIDGVDEGYNLMEGKTSKNGYFADSILIRDYEFTDNTRYNVTVTAQWYDPYFLIISRFFFSINSSLLSISGKSISSIVILFNSDAPTV